MGDYVGLRDALAPELSELDDEELDEELDPELAESLAALGSALTKAGDYARRAAPGAMQGALTGFQVAGPWGALVGAGAGAALGAKQPTAPMLTGAAPPPVATAVPNPAAVQLLALLSRPEVVQALQALALGHAGAPQVVVGNVPVPVGAFANLIQGLAESAAMQHHAHAPRVNSRAWSEHVAESAGESHRDVDTRGAVLLQLLASVEAEELDEDDDEDADLADMQDLADLARLGDD